MCQPLIIGFKIEVLQPIRIEGNFFLPNLEENSIHICIYVCVDDEWVNGVFAH
jgi:hypothetical protein